MQLVPFWEDLSCLPLHEPFSAAQCAPGQVRQVKCCTSLHSTFRHIMQITSASSTQPVKHSPAAFQRCRWTCCTS